MGVALTLPVWTGRMMWLTIGYAVNQMLWDSSFCFKPLWEGPGEMAGPCQHLAVVLEGEGQEELGLVCKREFTSATVNLVRSPLVLKKEA